MTEDQPRLAGVAAAKGTSQAPEQVLRDGRFAVVFILDPAGTRVDLSKQGLAYYETDVPKEANMKGALREVMESGAIKEPVDFKKLIESWTEFGMFNFLADRVGRLQAEEWIDSSYLPLARVAPAVVKDEAGHGDQGYHNLKKTCQTAKGRAEAQSLLHQWYPVALDMFGSSTSQAESPLH
jgi:1,2-phenylacetyl-CoA epoxidase catalytic subunit